jgi:hypothetical protein
LDIDKIFGSFNSSSRDDDDFPQVSFLTNTSKLAEDNHPRYYIKMFTKLIQNYTTYNKQLIRFFGSSDPELNIREIEETGELMLYNFSCVINRIYFPVFYCSKIHVPVEGLEPPIA